MVKKKGGNKDLEGLVLERSHGANLSRVMGDLLFKDLVLCVQEIVANCHDADAEDVDIAYSPGRGTLVISDNGTGMDKEGLRGFYRLGDSSKERIPRTKKGRTPIGKFGIATLVLRTLADHYTLESWKDGVHYTVEEKFTKEDTDAKKLDVRIDKCSPKSHGVRISIDKLKFTKGGRELDLSELRKRLSVEMPILPDFSMKLNAEPIKSRNIENGVEYAVEIEDRDVGFIRGSIYYSSRPLEEGAAGIYVKVHGRAVGGANKDLLGGNIALGTRVFGVVEANGLDDIVGLDRHDFLTDHPKFKALKEYLGDILKEVRRDMDNDLRGKNRRKARISLVNTLPQVASYTKRLLGDQTPGAYEIVFDKDKAGDIARVDTNAKKLFINPSSEVFVVSNPGIRTIRESLLKAAEYAELLNRVSADFRVNLEESILSAIRLRREELKTGGKRHYLGDLISGAEIASGSRVTTSSSRVYNYAEITRLTGRDNAVIKILVDAGLLNDRDGERVIGQDVITTVETLGDDLTIFEAIKKVHKVPEESEAHDYAIFQSREKTANKRLESMFKRNERLPPYIRNVALPKHTPLFVIDPRFLQSFKHFVDEGNFPKDVTGSKVVVYRDLSLRGESRGILAYIISTEKERKEVALVRDAVRTETDFMRDEGRLPPRVKTVSYFGPFNGSNYVLGVYAGNNLKPYVTEFKVRGFKVVEVDGKELTDLAMRISSQTSIAMPLTEVTAFDTTQREILQKMQVAAR